MITMICKAFIKELFTTKLQLMFINLDICFINSLKIILMVFNSEITIN